MSAAHPLRLIALMCLAEIGIMLGNSAFPALVPLFRDLWSLSNGEAGWISGIYYAGYVLAVPFLVAATDALQPRRIYLVAALLSALAPFAFATLAQGFWSAMALRALGGVALAGTYMVGLRMLTDRIEGRAQTRAVALYTSFFSIGNALSVWLAGRLAADHGWEMAFMVSAGGGALAFLIALFLVPPSPPRSQPMPWRQALNLKPALKNKEAFAYNLAYACHGWELFAFRSWLVAFLVYALAERSLPLGLSETDYASIVLLLGLPASVTGNELALRWGRAKAVTRLMWISMLVGPLVALSALGPVWLVMLALFIFGWTVTADSSAITNGAIAAAEPNRKGATMAVHSILGFAVATPAPVAFGYVLDVAGGEGSNHAWLLAFLLLAAGVALGPLFLKRAKAT